MYANAQTLVGFVRILFVCFSCLRWIYSDQEVFEMLRYSMTNSRRPSGLLVAMALLVSGAGLAACDRTPQGRSETPAATVAPAAPASAPSATEGVGSAETAKASDQPMKSMTKDQESTSMPRPGQANDHSTLSGDSKK